MEFFEFAELNSSEDALRTSLTADALPHYCAEIEEVADEGETDLVVYFAQWGRFHLRSETVMGGLRFSVPDCPNALAWTITTGYPPYPEKVTLHATINRTEHSPDFIQTTKDLLAAFKTGLENAVAGQEQTGIPVGQTSPGLQLVDLRPSARQKG